MGYVIVPIDGGLDLITPPVAVQPGKLLDCQNYEVARQRGLRRIDGYVKYDGGVSPFYETLLYLGVCECSAPSLPRTAGTTIYIQGDPNAQLFKASLVETIPDGTNTIPVYIYINNLTSYGSTVLNDTNTQYFLTDGATFPGPLTIKLAVGRQIPVPSFSGSSTVSNDLLFRANVYNSTKPRVQNLLGQGNILGLFYLKDSLYACRDMFAFNFTNGENEPQLGDYLALGTNAFLALKDWVGTIAKVVVTSGSWTAGNAAGVIMVYNEWNGPANVGFYAGQMKIMAPVRTVFNLNCCKSTITTATSQAAALYKADGERGLDFYTDTAPYFRGHRSWKYQDLGWHVSYNKGEADFIGLNLTAKSKDLNNLIQVTEWKFPTIADQGGWTYIGPDFISAITSDDGDTSFGLSSFTVLASPDPSISNKFTVTGFGFTSFDIPDTATITGIEIEVKRGSESPDATSGVVKDYSVGLVGTKGDLGLSFADLTTEYPGTTTGGATPYATKTYGGKQTLFAFTNVTSDVIKTPEFGMYFQSQRGPHTTDNVQTRVTFLRMRVYYLPENSQIYFWNGTSAVRANVVQAYKQTGDIMTKTATGQLYFQFVQADGTIGGQPSRPIGNNEEIRTYPGGGVMPRGDDFVSPNWVLGTATDGSSLIAFTNAVVDLNVMDWSALLAAPTNADGTTAPPSKYKSITKNFYASSGFDAIYGTSGAGPAFYYDGKNFTRILTGLDTNYEKPRSIAVHQSRIFLGYYSGLIQYSLSSNVLSFDNTAGTQDSGSIGMSDRVTGIAELNGDSLCVWTQSSTLMLQNKVNLDSFVSVINPTTGGIEYTPQPMANWMYADFRGITMIGATQKYGDFEIGHISAPIAPFLIPRLQLSSAFNSGNIGVINSVLVRNKNQYRLFFADGKAVTLTFLADGEPPQFTIQYYTTDIQVGGVYETLTWDVIEAFTESKGRDHIYGATNDGTGQVYEVDIGNSFNAAPIVSYAILVPDHVNNGGQTSAWGNKYYRDMHVYGQAQNYATFTITRSKDYDLVDSTKNKIPQIFGGLTVTPTGLLKPFFSNQILQLEGRAINIRVDANSNQIISATTVSQFPHVLQAIEYDVESLQPKVT